MDNFLYFDFFPLIKFRGQMIDRDGFFFSLPATIGVLLYILSAGITALRGK